MINPLRKRSKDQSSAQSSDAKINDEPDLSS